MSRTETDGQASAGHIVIDRPPPGLARGAYPLPAWAIACLGAAVLLAGLVYVAARLRGWFKR